MSSNVGFSRMSEERPFTAIGRRLLAIREARGLSRQEMAEIAGAGLSALSQWEKGGKRISIDAAMLVSKHLGVTLDYIYFGDVGGLPVQTLRLLERAGAPGCLPRGTFDTLD